MGEPDRFQLQDDEYEFPYHHLMGFGSRGDIHMHRQVDWGLAYLTYVSFIVDLLKRNRVRSMLSVGCGDGGLEAQVAGFIPRITGVDLSQRAIEFARVFNPGIEFICGDVADLSGQYQAVTLIEVMEHIPDNILPDLMASSAARIEPGGFMLVSVPTVNMPVSPKHFRHYTLERLAADLHPYLTVEQHWWLYRRGAAQRILRIFLRNRLFTLNLPAVRRIVWAIHRKLSYNADESSGLHLVAVGKPV